MTPRSRRFTHPPASAVPPSRDESGGPARRVNITLPEQQHDELQRRGANVSGVIRTLLDGYLSQSTISLRVDEATRHLYDEVLRSTGASEQELARALIQALQLVLRRKVDELEKLRKKLESTGD